MNAQEEMLAGNVDASYTDAVLMLMLCNLDASKTVLIYVSESIPCAVLMLVLLDLMNDIHVEN